MNAPTECSSEDGLTIGILDTICTMVHLLKGRDVPETGAVGEALEDARATLQRCELLVVPSAALVQNKSDMALIHEAAEKIRALEAEGQSPTCPACGNGMHRDTLCQERVWKCDMADCRHTVPRLKTEPSSE